MSSCIPQVLTILGLALVMVLVYFSFLLKPAATGLTGSTTSYEALLFHPIGKKAKRPLKISSFNCKAIIQGKRVEIRKAERYLKLKALGPPKPQPNINCSEVNKEFHESVYSESLKTEADFQLAFSILFHKNRKQLLKLLKTIYRPWNHYCIHVDRKVSDNEFGKIKSVSECFPNIILVEDRQNVTWGNVTVLKASLSCFRQLFLQNWNYLLNIAASDFPLKTNFQIIESLRQLEPNSDVEDLKQVDKWKFSFSFSEITYSKLKAARDSLTNGTYSERKMQPPHNITMHKGSFSTTLNREFVRFILQSKVAADFLIWLKDVYIPDEYFWSSLYHGYYKQQKLDTGSNEDPMKRLSSNSTPTINQLGMDKVGMDKGPFLTRYTQWGGSSQACHGYYEHGLCVFGVGDIKRLVKLPVFFAHKFDLSQQMATLDCLQEHIRNRTYGENCLDV